MLWAGLLLGTSIILWRDPGRGIFDVYRDATTHWWAAESLYRPGMRAFVYLTSGPLIFTPFTALGRPLDDVAWRIFSVALFLWGMFRLARLVRPSDAGVALATILLLMLPGAGVDVQRGQAAVAMAGWVFLGAADAAGQRWGKAALWLCLAVALKPLALVPCCCSPQPSRRFACPWRAVSRWCSLCRSCTRTRTMWRPRKLPWCAR